MKLCLSVLFVLVAVVVAGPMPQSTLLTALNQLLSEEITDIQLTTCASRAFAVRISFTVDNQTNTTVYKYRACLNRDKRLFCMDSRENLPPLCLSNTSQLYPECTHVIWYVRGAVERIEICDDNGVPCQKPVSGFMRTLPGGICDRKPTDGIKLCEKTPDGKEDCPDMTLSADAEGDGADSDCFCITPEGGQKVCRGKCRKEMLE